MSTSKDNYEAGTFGSRLVKAGGAAGVGFLLASILVAALGPNDHFKRFQYGFLSAWMLIFTIALGALFFMLIHHATRARWDTVLLRTVENIATTFPIVAGIGAIFILLPMWAGNHNLYFWDYWQNLPPELKHDEVYHHLAKKSPWLNVGFFSIRYVVYMLIYSGVAFWFSSQSRKQDSSGDPKINDKLRIAAGPLLVLVGMTTVFAGFDFEMSLSPEWYSTIFSVNMFGGAMVGFLAFLAILLRVMQKSGRLTKSVTTEHYHDIGKLLFGFNFFWAYTAFSPFMLIWYANIPEEVVWYRYRWEGTDWQYLSIAVILFTWLIPYVLLLSRWTKRIMPVFMLVCAEQLLFHFVDLYWNVMPNITWGEHDGIVTGPLTGPLAAHTYDVVITDWLSLIGVFALFVAAVGSRMKGNLVAVKNPTLGASLAFENY
jgi:hypothetical protein